MIYLAGPYSHPSKEVMAHRAELHAHAAATLLIRGYHPYSPIAHWHEIALTHRLPTHAEFWHNHNRAMVAKSSILLGLMLPGWRESTGMNMEMRFATECAVPVKMSFLSDLKDITFYLTGDL